MHESTLRPLGTKLTQSVWDIVRLIRLKVITYDDLSDFSDELKQEVKTILEQTS